MKVVIEIELGNEAMETPSDLSHAIQKSLSAQPLFEPLESWMSGAVVDGNGNTVGRWEVTV